MRLNSGHKGAYRRDAKPIGNGAYAQVFRAVHKGTSEVVAFKKLNDTLGDSVDRMRREISVMQQLLGQPGVMPILDADPVATWYVMPLADGDVKALRASLSESDLIALAEGVGAGLRAAHSKGLVHRDVTPTNALRMPNGEWVLADWGVVRRELGQTTRRLTEVDQTLGTDGFIAPEALRNAHVGSSAAADVYSWGQLMAYAVSGVWPLAGERKPPTGPWRAWVRDAIQENVASRPGVDELLDRLAEVGYTPDASPVERAGDLAEAARSGDDVAAWRLIELAEAHHDHADIFFDHLPYTEGAALDRLVRDATMAERLVSVTRTWLEDWAAWGRRDFDQYNRVLAWMRLVSDAARRADDLGLLEDLAEQVLIANRRLDRWRERDRLRKWVSALTGDAAAAVARAARRQPDAASWLAGDDAPSGLAPVLADALRPASKSTASASSSTENAPSAPASVLSPGTGLGSGPFNLHGTGSPFNAHLKSIYGKDLLLTQARLITDIGQFIASRGEADNAGEEDLPVRVPVGAPSRVSFHDPGLAGLAGAQGSSIALEVDVVAADGTGSAYRYYLTLLRRSSSGAGRPEWAAKQERTVVLG